MLNEQKPLCFEQDNKLEYLDVTGSPLPRNFPGIRGLTKLKYLSLANTRIESLPNDFLQYFPALEILKLSQLDIGKFINSFDGNFFPVNPALAEIHLDNCQLTDISSTLISGLIKFQRFCMTNMSTFPSTSNLTFAIAQILNF